MTLAVAAMSHVPGFGVVDPGGTIFEEMNTAIGRVRAFVEDFDPDVTIAFGPDHFNGVLYEMMPPFCIGAQASGIGDYGTREGPLPVDSALARELLEAVLAEGVDIARSERLRVDHGMLQPLEFLYGHDFTTSFVPIFVNSVGHPLTPMNRVRLLGEAVGRAAQKLDKRVLMLASGGLSHDPPLPEWDIAEQAVRDRITTGGPTREQQAAREAAILEGLRNYDEATATSMQPLDEEWDSTILDACRGGDLTVVDPWTSAWMRAGGGRGAQEVRTWIAAYSGLATAGPYHLVVDEYWPVHSWGSGFAVTAAVSDAAA